MLGWMSAVLPVLIRPAWVRVPEAAGPSDASAIGSPRLRPPVSLVLVHDASKDASSDASEAVLSFDSRRVASTAQFVSWLRDVAGGEELSLTRLLGLYFEFCEFREQRPLSERRLLNALAKHGGVQKWRPTAVVAGGRQHRPTVYWVEPRRSRRSAA